MTQTKLSKIARRVSKNGIRELPAWAFDWLYWNAKLYRLPGAQDLRAELKYRRAKKKFGIADPIIVYQMGKVGSSSVYNVLTELDLDVPVYHSHVLNNFEVYEEGVRRTRQDPSNDLEGMAKGRALRRIVDSGRWRRWTLINLVRAPVPRALSDFFENVGSYVPDFQQRLAQNKIAAAELIEVFMNDFEDTSPSHWYDEQVREVFGIDVFATPFPQARGYAVYENERARLLVMRLEDLETCAQPALRELLGLTTGRVGERNVGERKEYGALYRAFVEELRLTPEFVERMHHTRYAEHFYTPHELEASVARWRAR